MTQATRCHINMTRPAAPATAESMRVYYARRAATYEQVYAKPERQADLATLQAWLPPRFAGRHGLEIACGTGYWTAHAAARSAGWLATDVNVEVLAIAQAKSTLPATVRFQRADAYALAELAPQDRFDAALAAFWWSHVPQARLPAWLVALDARLEPGAVVVILDNRFVPGSSTPISRTDTGGDSYQLRTLEDGTTHEVLKNFPDAAQACSMLSARARQPQWLELAYYWVLSYTVA